jgi:hypothetical protein
MNETKDDKKLGSKPVPEPKPDMPERKKYTRKEIVDAQQAVKVNRWCGEFHDLVVDILAREALTTPEEEAPSPEPQAEPASPDREREPKSPARGPVVGHHRGR